MSKVTLKDLIMAADELNDIIGLDDDDKPQISLKLKEEPLKEKLIEAAGLLTPTDDISVKTRGTLEDIGAELPEEAEEKPKAKGKVVAKPTKKVEDDEDEDDDEDDDEDEEPAPKKGKVPAKPVKKVVEEDDDDDEDEEPVKKPAKKEVEKKAEKKSASKVSRGSCIYQALKSIPAKGKTVDELAEIANAAYIKAGGEDNEKQTLHHIKVLIPAALAWEVLTLKGELYFS